MALIQKTISLFSNVISNISSMKKRFKIIGIVVLLLILFRGIIFRSVVKYSDIGTRSEITITNQKLIKRIEDHSKNKPINQKNIIEIAKEITTDELQFTIKKTSNNPNALININQTNCVGYSAMFNAIANYLIKTHGLQHEIKAQHKIGQLEVFGLNIHQYFKSSFFKDHDFNEIIFKKTNDTISIDPSLSDYLWINRITQN